MRKEFLLCKFVQYVLDWDFSTYAGSVSISSCRPSVDEPPNQYDEYSESSSENPSDPKSSRSNSLFSPQSSRSNSSSITPIYFISWSISVANGTQVAPLLFHDILRLMKGFTVIHRKVVAL
jgi:hypothetical protein